MGFPSRILSLFNRLKTRLEGDLRTILLGFEENSRVSKPHLSAAGGGAWRRRGREKLSSFELGYEKAVVEAGKQP